MLFAISSPLFVCESCRRSKPPCSSPHLTEVKQSKADQSKTIEVSFYLSRNYKYKYQIILNLVKKLYLMLGLCKYPFIDVGRIM